MKSVRKKAVKHDERADNGDPVLVVVKRQREGGTRTTVATATCGVECLFGMIRRLWQLAP